ncbi:hypothetical protein ACWEJ7_08480 [Streptomyces albidoflavus]
MPGGPGQGFARTYGITRELGATLAYREYPMTDLGAAFLREVLGRAPDHAETGLLVRSYLAEWNAGVLALPARLAALGLTPPAPF